MRILVIEPYYGGSHKAFVDGWVKHSRHKFDLITFPAYKWKWRMRHSALSAAVEAKELISQGKSWDALFVSDMLGLAEFVGLAPEELSSLPRVVYFHENQLLYPDESKQDRDLHFAYMNFTTAFSANQVWFNTGWHRDGFLAEFKDFLSRMPDYKHLYELNIIAENSRVFGQGIYESKIDVKKINRSEELKLTWAARWEHDKNPDDLYTLLVLLKKEDLKFRVNIIGESFKRVPPIFGKIYEEFEDCIDRFGYQPSKEEYFHALVESDIVISTAIHEFFGVSVIEGCACGCIPVAPRRLAYPEVLCGTNEFLYDITAEDLCRKIIKLNSLRFSKEWDELKEKSKAIASRYYWDKIAEEMDLALEEMVKGI